MFDSYALTARMLLFTFVSWFATMFNSYALMAQMLLICFIFVVVVVVFFVVFQLDILQYGIITASGSGKLADTYIRTLCRGQYRVHQGKFLFYLCV